MSSSLFRQNSLDRISSPDQLNDYIKVSNPSIWMVLTALFIILGAVFVWGITGSLPTSISISGVAQDGEAVCYLDTESAGGVRTGQKVTIKIPGDDTSYLGVVKEVGTMPMSPSEISAELNSDYLSHVLSGEGFAVKVVVESLKVYIADGTLLNLRIVTDEVRPIDFLLE